MERKLRSSVQKRCRWTTLGTRTQPQAQPHVSMCIKPTCSSSCCSYGAFAEELSWFICQSSAKTQHCKSKRQVLAAPIEAGQQREAAQSSAMQLQVCNTPQTHLEPVPKSRFWQPHRTHQLHSQEPLSSHLRNIVDGPKRDHNSQRVGGKGLGMDSPKIT